jgi:hypothetical protein
MTLGRVPQPHDRVRVVFPATATQPERYLVGSLGRVTRDTLILARGRPGQDTVSLSAGRRLQTVLRRGDRSVSGAAIGGTLGVMIGAAVGAATSRPDTSTWGCYFICGRELGAVVGALVGGAAA